MKILVTGGSGYKGSRLVPLLLQNGHEVISFDSEWFGYNLKGSPLLTRVKEDIRNLTTDHLKGVEAIIHLANIANDPSVDLNPTMSWEVNVLAAQQLAEKAISSGVKHIIYASSGSVYGLKTEERVTEDLSLEPISVYNKTKMVAERVFMSYKEQIKVHIVRPATVCGLSPRMRFDVAVNMLTYQALSRGEITVLGGKQTRPNIHIDDIILLYYFLLENRNKIDSGFYNAGFENISITDIATIIKEQIDCRIMFKESNDPRSYRQDSSKILSLGFSPKKGVRDAIKEIIAEYQIRGMRDRPENYTVRWMKEKNLS